jgi:predicted hydrolase (HD superfamily)
MLTLAQANALIDRHLGDTPRAAHSRDVGRLMRALAVRFGGDETLWGVVGLCHDLDYFAVDGEWTRHGILAGEWLANDLPQDALTAIAAHDHRTGMADDSLMADMLKLADTIANIGKHAGNDALRHETPAALRERLGRRAYLIDILQRLMTKHGLTVSTLPLT